MLCDDRLWEWTARALSVDREVTRLPVRGSSVAAAVDAVLGLPIPRFDLGGLSLGGIVAMHVAVQAPERIRRLALLSTNARAPRPDQYAGWDEMQRRAVAGDLTGVARDLLPSLLRPQAQLDPSLTSTAIEMAQSTGVAALLDQLDLQRSRTDLLGPLTGVTCPTLVISAHEDALCPPHLHEEIAAALHQARLETIEDCGHLSALERPAAVAGLLRRWLDAPDEELEDAAPAHAGTGR
jgi:pimeloyl-ACP methyl ester carboxylesterase